jgi:hypothetical protein
VKNWIFTSAGNLRFRDPSLLKGPPSLVDAVLGRLFSGAHQLLPNVCAQ